MRRAYARAIRALETRPRSEREIDVLLGSRFTPEIVRATRERLREEGLLDDARFARMWAESRARGRGFGPVRIRYELAAKGISSEGVEHAITSAIEDETGAALAAAHARRRRYEGLPAEVLARRLAAWLRRQGYGTRIVIAVLQAEGIFAGPSTDGPGENADGGG